MGLSECYGIMKYILVFVNLIFWIIGAFSVVLSIWMLLDPTFLVSLSQDKYNFYAGLYVLLVAGTLMFIVAFLGCYGSYKESQCMLISFFSCMLVVIVAQVATGAWLYIHGNRLEELVRISVQTSIKSEYDLISSRTLLVDTFQQNLFCCGAEGPNDWAGSKFSNKDGNSQLMLTVNEGTLFTVPRSCCTNSSITDCDNYRSKIRIGDTMPSNIFDRGCTDQILMELRKQSTIFVGIIVGLGTLELLGLIFSLLLCCVLKSNDRYKT